MPDLELPDRFRNKPIYDLTQFYSEFVPFTANSVYPVHRWYRFKEGYSRDLVHLILGFLGGEISCCLDPFAGSGTTPLACQEVGVRCHSIEVNPFLHHLAKSKLNTQYTLEGFDKAVTQLRHSLTTCVNKDFEEPVMSTITERPNSKKWLFHRSVLQAILALRQCIKELESPYSDLFVVVLASILTDVGNTIKDGKCVRYKKGWRENKLTREQVCDLFLRRAKLFRADIQYVQRQKWVESSNADLCVRGSALEKLPHLTTDSVDAVITSPPYLNSFDYTDVYMPELWTLGFVKDYEDVQKLRTATLRSHVQVKWKTDEGHLDDELRELISEVVDGQETLWNNTIPDMIAGYFLDMQKVLAQLERVIRPNGKLCIVIATSSYNKVVIPTDLLTANLAADVGFDLDEMRVVRRFKRSTEQTTGEGKSLPPLRESVLFLSAT